MTTEKKSKNPFINAAVAAKKDKVQAPVVGQSVGQGKMQFRNGPTPSNKPAKKSAGRGR